MVGVEGRTGTAIEATWLASGAVVFLAFLYPRLAGVMFEAWQLLAVAVTFVGCGLLYLCAMPSPAGADGRDRGGPEKSGGRLADRVAGAVREQDPVVAGVAGGAIALTLLARFLRPEPVAAGASALRGLLLRGFGWWYLGATALAVAFCLAVVVGPWGRVRLGGPDAEPDYGLATYVVMTTTAGVAAGLILAGSTDVLAHYRVPPPWVDAPARSEGAIAGALATASFHWGISAWSTYAAVGVPVAYLSYNRGAPFRPSALLAPVFGADGLDGPGPRLFDALAVLAVVGAVGTSVASVTEQFMAGVGYQWEVQGGGLAALLFVALVTTVFTAAAASGVVRGVRRIATATGACFVLLTVLVFAQGPTGPVTRTAAAATVDYLREFVALSVVVRDAAWRADWTAFYWVWWFGWAAFVGPFLAGISRGRRLRTVVLAGVFAPATALVAWLQVVGGTFLRYQHTGVVEVLPTVLLSGTSVAVYPVLERLLLGRLMVFLLLVVLVGFVVASADVATLAVALTAVRPGRVPSRGTVALWGVVLGAVAATFVLVEDAASLRTLSVLAGTPVAVASVVGMAGTVLSLWRG